MHDIPDNCVVVGSSARVIGTFDDYAEKMLGLEKYPEMLKPRKQAISDGLEN